MTEIWFFAVAILVVFIILAAVRLAIGPTGPDRAVALDTINTYTIASLILLGVAFQQVIFIDVAIVYAVLSFVSTIYIAKYLGGEMP